MAPVATGVARGNLGTATAVDDETTLMAVPVVPVAPTPTAQPAPNPAPDAAVVTGATRPARRDPYRPIGIALAAVLVTLAGVAVLSSGGGSPGQVGAPPAATEAAPTNPDGAQGGDEGNGNGHGNGNGNGNGNGGGRGND